MGKKEISIDEFEQFKALQRSDPDKIIDCMELYLIGDGVRTYNMNEVGAIVLGIEENGSFKVSQIHRIYNFSNSNQGRYRNGCKFEQTYGYRVTREDIEAFTDMYPDGTTEEDITFDDFLLARVQRGGAFRTQQWSSSQQWSAPQQEYDEYDDLDLDDDAYDMPIYHRNTNHQAYRRPIPRTVRNGGVGGGLSSETMESPEVQALLIGGVILLISGIVIYGDLYELTVFGRWFSLAVFLAAIGIGMWISYAESRVYGILITVGWYLGYYYGDFLASNSVLSVVNVIIQILALVYFIFAVYGCVTVDASIFSKLGMFLLYFFVLVIVTGILQRGMEWFFDLFYYAHGRGWFFSILLFLMEFGWYYAQKA